MRRFLAVGISFCLCIVICDAQTKDSLIISHTTIIESKCQLNAQQMDSLKRLYYRRVYERIHQLDNYIRFVSSSSIKRNKRLYYQKCIRIMFHPLSTVKVKFDNSIVYYNLKSFVKELTGNLSTDKVGIFIDSVCIPKWIPSLIANDSIGIVFSPSEMIPMRNEKTYDNEKSVLIIRKEETEDGNEWVPQFGNLIVTIINRHEKNKANFYNDYDAISSKLR